MGIVTAVIFVLVSSVFFTGKLKEGSRARRFFPAVHKPFGYLLLAAAAVHLVLTLPLIRQRPAIIYVLGAAMAVCAVLAAVTGRGIKDRGEAFRRHRLCALVMAILLAAHMGFCAASFGRYKRDVAAISFDAPEISAVPDGEYTGQWDVGYIYAKVRVRVESGAVTGIELLEHLNERGKAGEGVVGRILSEQRTDVDAVSGATNSSKVIIKAVENALEKGIDRRDQA